ncbi:hypothetical protein [Clostridium chromiireducens]|uniref:hypothetical protein n=1 Tax=Clostridium chromiireducens TaxID=225345 RepID=UPI001FA9FEAF|nr:hypothetical protein [Clostridium chromiireducens]
MDKNVKRMISITLAMVIISSITPITKINLFTTKTYAADKENSETTLESLELRTSSGSNLRLYENDDYESQYKIKVKYTGKDVDLNSEDQEEEEYDDIYLERLSVDGESLNLINSKPRILMMCPMKTIK